MKTVVLNGQWGPWADGTVEAYEVNGMLCIPEPEGVVYVTKEQAMEFFGLVEPPKKLPWGQR